MLTRCKIVTTKLWTNHDHISRAIQTASPTEKAVLEKALGEIAPSVAQELNVPLAKLIPIIPKAIKGGSIVKYMVEGGLIGGAIKGVYDFGKGLLGNYLQQNVAPHEETVHAAPR